MGAVRPEDHSPSFSRVRRAFAARLAFLSSVSALISSESSRKPLFAAMSSA